MKKKITAADVRKALPMDRDMFEYEFKQLAASRYLDIQVLSEGPMEASIAFVGDGPGEQEVKQRRPWVGGAGKLLWDTLRPYGLDRGNCYVSNVVKRQVSLSRKGNERNIIPADEMRQWEELLHWELEQLPNLKIIFILGGTALEAILKKEGILKWRGSVLDHTLPDGRQVKVVIANNPAYAQRELSMEPIFVMDCHKLNLVHTNKFVPYQIEHIINPTYKEARAFIRDLKRVKRPVSLDVEHISGHTACYGLSNDPHKAMCINFRDMVENRYTLGQEADIMIDLQDLCDSHKIICQSGGHERYYCWMRDRLVIRPWYDTLLAHHLLYPRLPHNLGFLVAQYTMHPFYKDEFDSWQEGKNLNTFWRYNCKDAALTFRVYERTHAELVVRQLIELFFGHVMRAQPHTAEATVHGIAVDHDVKKVIVDMCQRDVDKLRDEVWRLARELVNDDQYSPNPGSWQQMQELYFDFLQLKGRGRSTDETNRYHMLNEPTTPPLAKELLTAVGKWSTESKFLGTFAKARASDDGRMRTDYKQAGVKNAPGRLSSAATIEGEGLNMQNQPVRARAMYVADPGAVLLYFDLKQAEAQVVGFRANIPKWKAQFAQARIDGKYDCHRALASDMFKVQYEMVPVVDWDKETGEPTIRYVAKRCRHGLNYRMERFRLSEVTELPYHAASRAFSLYHQTTPELRKWWDQEEKAFRQNKVILNAFGRPFKVVQRIDEEVLKSIVAFYPQSTVGDKVVRVWYKCEEDDDWPDKMYARVGIDVHDNLVALSMPKYAKTCLRIMKKWAEEPIMIKDAWGRGPEPLSIGADLKMSYPTVAVIDKKGELRFEEGKNGLHRWSHMKEVVL